MDDDELERRIGELFSAPPALHTDFDGSLVTWGIDPRMVPVIRELVRPGHVTLETGAGVSTILLLLLGAVHRSITPDEREVTRILEYCDRQGIPTTNYHPILGPSERVLPALPSDLILDFALIDGNHAFPGPAIDWYYITDHLETHGVLAVDDVQLWPPRILADFLDEEDVWQRLVRTDRFAVYRMTAPRGEVLGRWWGQQRFVVRHSQVGSLPGSGDPPAPSPSPTETEIGDEVGEPTENRPDGNFEPRPNPRRVGSLRRLRPQLTVAVPFPVYPPLGGGQLRVFSLYRHLARDFDVELVTLAESDAQFSEHEIAPGMREIRVPKSLSHQEEEARLMAEVGGIPVGDIGLPRFLDDSPEYGRYLARSIETATLVVVSHPYALPAIRPALGGRPLVYEAHNVEYLLKKEVFANAGAVGAELVKSVRDLEAEACDASRLIFCCSAHDRDDLCALYGIPPDRVAIVPNGVDGSGIPFTAPSERKRRKAEVGLGDAPIALFVGSWHPPNLEAAEALFEVAQAMPAVRFLLAGSQCLPLADRPRPANVGLMGVVDEETLAVLLAVADVALNPMLSGSGSNLKLATYLAAGVPVITTPLGARGYDLLHEDTALICPLDGFPNAIMRLLDDNALRDDLASRGRGLVERQYEWQSIASGVTAALRRLLPLAVGRTDPLEVVVDRVGEELVALGATEHHLLLSQVARAVAEVGAAGLEMGSAPRAESQAVAVLSPRPGPALTEPVPDWWLAATRAQLAQQSVHDPDFLAFARYPFFRRHARVVMDVGANRGQSIASFLATLPDVEIHAFEAHPIFHGVLETVAAECAGRVHVYPFGLGKEDAIVDFYLPSGGGVAFLEEASTRREYFDLPWVKQKFADRGGLSLRVIPVTIKRGDGCALNPDIIKVDVEGAEADVLAGLEHTIEASRPVLLVENADWHTVTSFLSRRGYRPYRFIETDGTLVPFFGDTTNTFYVHESLAARVLAKSETSGTGISGTPAELRALADSVPFWFHSIDLGHGVVTGGLKSADVLAAEIRNLRLPDLRGKTVLDIGAWDGFFSFQAERLGAARVVSLDHYMWEKDPAISRYYQDCREKGVPPQPGYIRSPLPPADLPGKRGYDIAARVLGSKAEAIVDDFMTMDLARLGQFDVVLYLGVLYHMQDPLAALRRVATVTRELAVIESEAIMVPGFEPLAICEFYEGSELNQDASNWWAPNQKALEGMCRAAGFARVETLVGPPRQVRPTSPTAGGGPSLVHYRTVMHAWK